MKIRWWSLTLQPGEECGEAELDGLLPTDLKHVVSTALALPDGGSKIFLLAGKQDEKITTQRPKCKKSISEAVKTLAKKQLQEEIDIFLKALTETNWNRTRAAVRLNMDYKAFLYKMKKLGI